MHLSYSCEHISSNCNPMPQTLIFLNPKTIAYCFRDQVGLYDMAENRVKECLNYRSSQIDISINRANCLVGIGGWLVVGYDSGHVVVYGRKQAEGEGKKQEQGKQEGQVKGQADGWKVWQVLKQPYGIISMHLDGDTLITNNLQAQVFFYSITAQHDIKTLTHFDTLKFPQNKILSSIVQFQPHNKPLKILFMGGIDQKIYCYTRDQVNGPLQYRFFLSGHQNGITKLTITEYGNGDYLLASASKDGYIRLWRVTAHQQLLKFHKNVRCIEGLGIYCFLEAVLISHQSSVTNLVWSKFGGKLQLVSCSLDCTICVWGCENEGSAWTVDTRMGQLLGNKNAYFNIVCSPNYQHLISVNYIGSALIWQFNPETSKFTLRPSFNGHTNEVTDIDWDQTGNFLVSVSKDQTTRVISRNYADGLFHQISRAQVHGYDINAVAVVKSYDGVVDLIACGADQKVIRIVEPPACFANYLNCFTKANLHLYFPNKQQQNKYIVSNPGSQILQYQTYAQGGTQVLGLMTKVQHVQRQKISTYYQQQQGQQLQQQQKVQTSKQQPINFSIPPHDDYLIKHTLWPEMNKLYGHPHQISALAKNNKRRLLASACEGKNKIFCTIIIWSTEDWRIVKTLQHHSYTVYNMSFSPCGNYFASASKDRKLAVFNSQNFNLIFSYQAHTRAITCVAFSSDSKYIVTGGRDKWVRVHSVSEGKVVAGYEIGKEVDAVEFCGAGVVAVGCIDGTILFLGLDESGLKEICRFGDGYSHTKAVTKLRYKNGLLASSSQDHSVRVFKIKIEN